MVMKSTFCFNKPNSSDCMTQVSVSIPVILNYMTIAFISKFQPSSLSLPFQENWYIQYHKCINYNINCRSCLLVLKCQLPTYILRVSTAWYAQPVKTINQHFAMPSLVSPRCDVWETSADIPYWWCVTIQIRVVPQSKFPTQHDQSEALPKSG